MEIQQYFIHMKELNEILLTILENSDLFNENYEHLVNFINKNEIQKNKEEFIHFLNLLINITNNHHRKYGFFKNIEQILFYFKDEIKQFFINIEIFHLFESNKRLILFLIKENILKIDYNLKQIIMSKRDPNRISMFEFFIPEINQLDINQNKYLTQYLNDIENYEEKRKQGENDLYICTLIRQDSVEEFIIYINRNNIPISSTIKPSIFESNSFLNEHIPTLIEYSAFFGSIQIFQYLRFNNSVLPKSLWHYAIHSNNAEIIHLLEEINVKPEDETYEEILNESIKCHHNELAVYIQDNLLNNTSVNIQYKNDKIAFDERYYSNIFQYSNYIYFPTNYHQDYMFYYLCQYNYTKAIKLLLFFDDKRISVDSNQKEKMIQQAATQNDIKTIYSLLSNEIKIESNYFKRNKYLKRIAILSSIKTIENYSFYECHFLTSILVPPSVTSIERGAFRQCVSLKQINIDSSISIIEDFTFESCFSLSQITIPKSVSSIGEWSFGRCSSLTQIIIPSSVTSIGLSAFYGCKSLKTILIDKNSSLVNIDDFAFYECISLEQIILPSCLNSIGESAFYSCSSLKEISIPSSVISIGKCAFLKCLSLTQITINSYFNIQKIGIESNVKVVKNYSCYIF